VFRFARIAVLAALVAPASLASPVSKPARLDPDPSGSSLDCSGATFVTCSYIVPGQVPAGEGSVTSYGCSGLEYAGSAEVVYQLCVGAEAEVAIRLEYDHVAGANDLDLFLLGSCDPNDCREASVSVTGIENIETTLAAGTYWLVVDGWNGASNGSGHLLEVDCNAPCQPTSIEPETWAGIKARYSDRRP
jgi:hypothetical protein